MLDRSVKSYAELQRLVREARAAGYPPEDVRQLEAYLRRRVEAIYKAARERNLNAHPEAYIRDDLDILATSVERATKIPKPLFIGRSRQAIIVSARRCFVWAATRTTATLCEIANYLGRPGGHTSVMFLRDSSSERERALGVACHNRLCEALRIVRAFGGKRSKAQEVA